jgi:hypothetical protein
MVRPERVELPTFWFVGFGSQILNALSSVAYGRQDSKTCPQLGHEWATECRSGEYAEPSVLRLLDDVLF